MSEMLADEVGGSPYDAYKVDQICYNRSRLLN